MTDISNKTFTNYPASEKHELGLYIDISLDHDTLHGLVMVKLDNRAAGSTDVVWLPYEAVEKLIAFYENKVVVSPCAIINADNSHDEVMYGFCEVHQKFCGDKI